MAARQRTPWCWGAARRSRNAAANSAAYVDYDFQFVKGYLCQTFIWFDIDRLRFCRIITTLCRIMEKNSPAYWDVGLPHAANVSTMSFRAVCNARPRQLRKFSRFWTWIRLDCRSIRT